MKYLIVFLYWIITWSVKIIINVFEFLFHFDFKHFSYYGTHFLTLKDIRDTPYPYSILSGEDGLNFFEKIIRHCVKN